MIQLTEKCIGYDSPDRQKFNEKHIFCGLQMTFQNGNTISIQFGFGNYCDNKFTGKTSCNDAEIAIWNDKDVWYNFESDQVKGYCNTDEIAKWINFAANNTF